ncbi:helix-turn-helix transcriptional regulator [Terricaulis sp.]|uniref:helix-turn-helix transcriptional regulator n=1 Tax=Terricaulis sp. TaxID=2768686 RepID=UPI00378314AF
MQSETIDLVGEAAARAIIGGAETPISRATLWRGVKAGRYPRPLKVGLSSNRWKRGELLAVLEKAAAAREVAA